MHKEEEMPGAFIVWLCSLRVYTVPLKYMPAHITHTHMSVLPYSRLSYISIVHHHAKMR